MLVFLDIKYKICPYIYPTLLGESRKKKLSFNRKKPLAEPGSRRLKMLFYNPLIISYFTCAPISCCLFSLHSQSVDHTSVCVRDSHQNHKRISFIELLDNTDFTNREWRLRSKNSKERFAIMSTWTRKSQEWMHPEQEDWRVFEGKGRHFMMWLLLHECTCLNCNSVPCSDGCFQQDNRPCHKTQVL